MTVRRISALGAASRAARGGVRDGGCPPRWRGRRATRRRSDGRGADGRRGTGPGRRARRRRTRGRVGARPGGVDPSDDRVSCGDSAGPSARAATRRTYRQSRPGSVAAAARTATTSPRPAGTSRSRSATASSIGRARLTSTAVRRGTVTRGPPRTVISAGVSARRVRTTPGTAPARPDAWTVQVTASSGSARSTPRSTAALRPLTTAPGRSSRATAWAPHVVVDDGGGARVDVRVEAAPRGAAQLPRRQQAGGHDGGAAEHASGQLGRTDRRPGHESACCRVRVASCWRCPQGAVEKRPSAVTGAGGDDEPHLAEAHEGGR